MKMHIVLSLYKKEMLDVLRDKKTVLMMLVVPLVLYPLMFVAGLFMMTQIQTTMEKQTYRLCVVESEETQGLVAFLKQYEGDENLEFLQEEDPFDALAKERADVVIDAYLEQDPENSHNQNQLGFRISYAQANTNSSYAADLVSDMLDAYEKSLSKELLEQQGLSYEQFMNPVEITYQDISTTEESAGNLLGIILPFMLIVSLLLGTMYPAIDTTAGERERGTLETVLTLPVSNQELVASKFLAVATIGVASAMLNLLAMAGVGAYMFQMIQSMQTMSQGIDVSKFVPAILIGILCVIAFAIFISAISMCVCAFAKSYKEANNYITPLMLVVMFASFVGFIPNVNLDEKMALVPVANICLLIKNLLVFKLNIAMVLLVLFSNILYGILAILFLGKIYNSEAVLFGDGKNGVQIFEKRSNIQPGNVATYGDILLVLAIMMVAIVYLGSAMSLSNVTLGVIGTQVLILLLPVFAVWYGKKDAKKVFKLRGCRFRYFLGGILLAIGGVLLGILLTALTSQVFQESAYLAQTSMEVLMNQPFWLNILLIAGMPAICEELMFRGFVFSGFETKMKPLYAILLAGSIFGFYHMSIVKFFTTAMLGCITCYVAHKSKSIFPGMLMHFLNNALSVVVMTYPAWFRTHLSFLAEDTLDAGTAVLVFVFGALFAGIGVLLVRGDKRKTIVVD